MSFRVQNIFRIFASSGEISKSNAVLTNHYEDRDVVDDRGTL